MPTYAPQARRAMTNTDNVAPNAPTPPGPMTASQIPAEDVLTGMTPADEANWRAFYCTGVNRAYAGQVGGYPSGDWLMARAYGKAYARLALDGLRESLSATRAGVVVGYSAPVNQAASGPGIFAQGAVPPSGPAVPVRHGQPALDDREQAQLWDRPAQQMLDQQEHERRVARGVARLHQLAGTQSRTTAPGALWASSAIALADTAGEHPFPAQRSPAVRPFALPPISNREALLRDTLNQQREKFARGELPGQQAAPAQTAWPTQAQYADRPTSYRLADSAPPRWAQSELPHVLSEGELAVLQRVKVYAKQGARKPGEPLFFEP